MGRHEIDSCDVTQKDTMMPTLRKLRSFIVTRRNNFPDMLYKIKRKRVSKPEFTERVESIQLKKELKT